MRPWCYGSGPARLLWLGLVVAASSACLPEEERPDQVLGFQPELPAVSLQASPADPDAGEPAATPAVPEPPGQVPSPSPDTGALPDPPSVPGADPPALPSQPDPDPEPEPIVHPPDDPVILATAVGLSARSNDAAGYLDAIERASLCADAALVQVTFAWDFLRGENEGVTYRAAYDWLVAPDGDGLDILQRSGLRRAFWLSFTDPNHPEQLAAPNIDGFVGFADPQVRAAFVAECAWFAEHFRPDYLALGVEIDSYLASASSAEREGFLSALQDARAACRAVQPGCCVFAYFQYENVRSRGLWSVITPFARAGDAYGFSSYPSMPLAGANSGLTAATFGDTYYDEILEQLGSDRPVVLAEFGHPAGPSGYFEAGNELEQADMIARLYAALGRLDVALVSWTYLYDPDLSSVYAPASSEYFGSMGLLRVDSGLPDGAGWSAWRRQ